MPELTAVLTFVWIVYTTFLLLERRDLERRDCVHAWTLSVLGLGLLVWLWISL